MNQQLFDMLVCEKELKFIEKFKDVKENITFFRNERMKDCDLMEENIKKEMVKWFLPEINVDDIESEFQKVLEYNIKAINRLREGGIDFEYCRMLFKEFKNAMDSWFYKLIEKNINTVCLSITNTCEFYLISNIYEMIIKYINTCHLSGYINENEHIKYIDIIIKYLNDNEHPCTNVIISSLKTFLKENKKKLRLISILILLLLTILKMQLV